MDDEFLGDFNYVVCNTDSQKSIASTFACSQESRTDGSSGKESRRTYVLQADSDSARSRHSAPAPAPAPPIAAAYDHISLHSTTDFGQKLALAEMDDEETLLDVGDALAERELPDSRVEAALQTFSLLSQETFTQTSKTIFELAQTNYVKCNLDTHAIETQTSRVSIVENKTIEYRIEVSGSQTRFTRNEILAGPARAGRLRGSPSDSQDSDASSGTLRIIDDEPEIKTTVKLEPSDSSSEDNADTSKYDTDFTDSLEDECYTKQSDQCKSSDESVAKSVDKDVEELYTNLEKSFELRSFDRHLFDVPRYATLSPLTEETGAKAESFIDSRRDNTRTQHQHMEKPSQKHGPLELRHNIAYTEAEHTERWRLPPIQKRTRAGSAPWRSYSPEPPAPRDSGRGDWAAGESATLAARTALSTSDGQHLPPIRAPSPASRGDGAAPRARDVTRDAPRDAPETISIRGKIQQLKMHAQAGSKRILYGSSTTDSRSSSPGSASERWGGAAAGAGAGAGGGAGADVTARGCEALCADVVARLRQACSCSRPTFEQHVSRHESSDGCGAKWAAVVEVLEDLPRLFSGFWRAVPEHRVADLLRLVTAQVESPRTRVARAACAALAALLSHTNYTKKPDFDEAVAALLGKTGSMAGALRRAANLALDQVVAGAAPAPAPALSALCLFGADHKSGLVRCAAARLLVVAAALAAGGRGLLRARPRSAASARRLALRALAALLTDRSQDTRKYAERLYCLLRPLPGFEAFFLADVDARTACRLMKKYDRLLAPPPPPPQPAPPPPPPR